MLHAVAEPMSHDARVICERRRRIAIEPAAVLLQRLRQIPMVEAEPRRDAVRDEPIDQTFVKVEAALLHGAAARRQNARPRGRKPVGGKIAACEQIDMVAPAVVVVAGDVAGVAVLHASRRMGEDIPDAFAASVIVDRAFDLIARGRRAPHEVRGKRTVVGSGCTGARHSTRGEQADGRGQQPSARHDQHRGRAAPAGAHGREGGGRGMKPASGDRNIGRRGDDWAARGVVLMISPRRNASRKLAHAQTGEPRRGDNSKPLKSGAPGEIRTHDLCLRRATRCPWTSIAG